MAIDYTSIDEVVNDFQLMIDDTSYDKEAHVYQLRLLALQGLRELTFDVEQVVKTDSPTVGRTSLTSPLPSDYVKILRVGFKGSDGNFHALGNNPNLSLDAEIDSQVNDGSSTDNNPNYSLDAGKKFGVGGGNNALGYYRLNRNDNTINFSSNLGGKKVFIEYMSDGVSDEMPQDHIMKLSFNASTIGGDGIAHGSTLHLPAINSSVSKTAYTFKANGSGTYTPSSIHFNIGDDAITIAQKFADTINEGYPIKRISPLYFSDIRASNDGNTVTLIYSNSTAVPISSGLAAFNANYIPSGSPNHTVLSGPIELIQLGVAGSGPRVHKFCEEALRCYIYYKYVQRKRGIPANEKQMAKRAFFNEKRLARARMMSFSKETALQTSRKAFKQSPKF